MSKRRLAVPMIVCIPLLAACGGGITVQVLADGDEAAPVEDLQVEFLPFDRDSLFAAMAGQTATPEPQLPADLEQAADSVRVLQNGWRAAEAAWNNVRDSMRSITGRLESLDQRAAEYRRLFQTFDAMEGREASLNRRRQAAFRAFDEMQQSTQERLDSMRIVIQAWEEVAFAGYDDATTEIMAALGRQTMVDTTNADGVAVGTVSGGPWWVYTRLTTPEGELYWNVMVDGSSSDTLRLQRDNAELRPIY